MYDTSGVKVDESRCELEEPLLEDLIVGVEIFFEEVAAWEIFHLDVEVLFLLWVATGMVFDYVRVLAEAENGILVESECLICWFVLERDLYVLSDTFLIAVVWWDSCCVKTEP